jgi:hypothetical protein
MGVGILEMKCALICLKTRKSRCFLQIIFIFQPMQVFKGTHTFNIFQPKPPLLILKVHIVFLHNQILEVEEYEVQGKCGILFHTKKASKDRVAVFVDFPIKGLLTH